jgi:protein-disulfide isomerase
MTKLCVLFLFAIPLSGAVCPDVSVADQLRLARYVTQRYRIPSDARLRVEDITTSGDPCYRKVTFVGAGSLGPFRTTLYVSPDLRFLSRELFDSSIDPQQERRLAAETTMGKLLDGEYAARGPVTAPVTMVVFSDFECPFCKRMKTFIADEPLIKTNAVRLIFRHMPMPNHPWAQKASEAAACAQFQSAASFWSLHDSLFDDQGKITSANLSVQIEELASRTNSLDLSRFHECLNRQMSLGTVLRDREIGERAGVIGTPAVFLNGELLPGIRNAAELHQFIAEALEKNQQGGSR